MPAPFTPPENFAMVWRGIYRSSYPSKRNFSYLQAFGLRTIVYLCHEEYPELNYAFMQEHGVQLLQFGCDGNKAPFHEIPAYIIRRALRAIMDPRNHPVLIHCNQGTHRTGCLVGCLRKVQQWSLVAIFEEYRRFAGTKARVVDELFIERFTFEGSSDMDTGEGEEEPRLTTGEEPPEPPAPSAPLPLTPKYKAAQTQTMMESLTELRVADGHVQATGPASAG